MCRGLQSLGMKKILFGALLLFHPYIYDEFGTALVHGDAFITLYYIIYYVRLIKL